VASIELFGTTDNYNMEASERLYIDMAKDAYQATNRKDEYLQMMQWLECKEKMIHHEQFIKWRLAGRSQPQSSPVAVDHHTYIKMTKYLNIKVALVSTFVTDYGAHDFWHQLTIFIAHINFPNLIFTQLQNTTHNIILPFQCLPVFHKIKVWIPDPQYLINAVESLDIVHVCPQHLDKKCNKWTPPRFDTVLVSLDGASLDNVYSDI
jgi:hypothetical protein